MKVTLKNKAMTIAICLIGLITLLMVPSLVLASEVRLSSSQSSVQPRWSYLWVCDNAIDYAENISRGISLAGSTKVRSNKYAGVEIQLEKYINSCECWMNVPTYYWEAYEEDDYAQVAEDDISLSTGTYRFSILHTAYDTDGLPLESFAASSDEITIR